MGLFDNRHIVLDVIQILSTAFKLLKLHCTNYKNFIMEILYFRGISEISWKNSDSINMKLCMNDQK